MRFGAVVSERRLMNMQKMQNEPGVRVCRDSGMKSTLNINEELLRKCQRSFQRSCFWESGFADVRSIVPEFGGWTLITRPKRLNLVNRGRWGPVVIKECRWRTGGYFISLLFPQHEHREWKRLDHGFRIPLWMRAFSHWHEMSSRAHTHTQRMKRMQWEMRKEKRDSITIIEQDQNCAITSRQIRTHTHTFSKRLVVRSKDERKQLNPHFIPHTAGEWKKSSYKI